jgi:hypothetical protein
MSNYVGQLEEAMQAAEKAGIRNIEKMFVGLCSRPYQAESFATDLRRRGLKSKFVNEIIYNATGLRPLR